MDKIGYFFLFGLSLASFTTGTTFSIDNKEVMPWLFRVGVIISLIALYTKYNALVN